MMFSQRLRTVVLAKCRRSFSKYELKSFKELDGEGKFILCSIGFGAGFGIYVAKQERCDSFMWHAFYTTFLGCTSGLVGAGTGLILYHTWFLTIPIGLISTVTFLHNKKIDNDEYKHYIEEYKYYIEGLRKRNE